MNFICDRFMCVYKDCPNDRQSEACFECSVTSDSSQCLHCVIESQCVQSYKRSFMRSWRVWYREMGSSFFSGIYHD